MLWACGSYRRLSLPLPLPPPAPQAHIQAAEALASPSQAAAVAGQAYFITNADPQPFWGFMGDVCEGLGYGRPRIHLPFALIYAIALFVQYVVTPLLSPFKAIQTDFTPFRWEGREAAGGSERNCWAGRCAVGQGRRLLRWPQPASQDWWPPALHSCH